MEKKKRGGERETRELVRPLQLIFGGKRQGRTTETTSTNDHNRNLGTWRREKKKQQ